MPHMYQFNTLGFCIRELCRRRISTNGFRKPRRKARTYYSCRDAHRDGVIRNRTADHSTAPDDTVFAHVD